ncbi:hypothetical protein A7U60_g1880 [Sanghuangporus baumii]|uniref:Elongation factor 1 alpha-like protein n=1 Tax=Sanghuangporus baumii TaxID=108892 RepID=A0A9Q5NBB0_SANBA|nr:hypothetical protein A7U60_g1880 [Sanghuangporus baumii]
MSRHRAVRNMNIQEELDDDAYYDEEELDFQLTPEQYDRLDEVREQVVEAIGYPSVSGIPEESLNEIIIYNDFDVEKSLRYIEDEMERMAIANERKEPAVPSRLSTISERTERTERTRASHQSGAWPSRHELLAVRRPPSTPTPTTSSYGQVLHPSASTFGLKQRSLVDGEARSVVTATSDDYENERTIDPNDIHPSPSLSAIRHLEIRTPSPSPSRSVSTVQAPPQQKVYQASGDALRGHGIKTSSSISSLSALRQSPQALTERSLPKTPRSERSQTGLAASHASFIDPISEKDVTPKKSKLASLASSRKSKAAPSESSMSCTTSDTLDTVATFPALRPRSLTSHTSVSITAPDQKDDRVVTPSLDQQREKLKMMRAVREPFALPILPPHAPSTPTRSEAPSLKSIPSEAQSTSWARRSELATGVTTTEGPAPLENEPIVTEKPTSVAEKPTMSKLAQLAQAKAANREHTSRKVQKPRILDPPFAETKYLKPSYNNSSMTTAITTYTQSVDNMVAMSRADLPPSYPLEGKQSKLSLKAKNSGNKPASSTADDAQREALERARSHAQNLLYNGNVSRAEPSSFASLLVNDRDHIKQPKVEESEFLPKQKAEQRAERKAEERLRQRMRKEALLPMHLLNPSVLRSTAFAFDVPSPDDVVLNSPARERDKAEKAKNKQIQSLKSGASSASTSRTASPVPSSTKASTKQTGGKKTVPPSKPTQHKSPLDQQAMDISSLHLDSDDVEEPVNEPPPKISIAREKVLEEARKSLNANTKKAVSLVVIGHVDAGKSTLMGRLLYELGLLDERKRLANERESNKMGKGSFTWAWEMDGTIEERERGVTMDIAQQMLDTPNRRITVLDAPGHKDFIPNMISGATQADCALLVVDAATGEFEAGFDRGGQTREHLVLVRSLGVAQVIVAVNKLDQVNWDRDRYEEICDLLRPFLTQTGFNASRVGFVPVGALSGVNLARRDGDESNTLNSWYKGPTLVDLLNKLEPPTRAFAAPLRFPISNVFKGTSSSGTGVSGRLCSGVVQVGEQLRILPGDETAVVKSIEVDEESKPWASAGSNATLYLTNIDPIHLSIGSVLCPPSDLVPLTTSFTARVIIFDIELPITIGAPVELFHHSYNVPASVTAIIATLDRGTGAVVKRNPRVLTRGASAEVRITLRTSSMSGPTARAQVIPLEPFSMNKDMGRFLLRRGGETIAAGIVLDVAPK